MVETTLAILTDFGAAGLIGVLWITERRQAAKRDRQLDEAHERILAHRRELDIWITLVRENANAVSRLEQAQRELVATLQRWRGPDRSDAA